ncbi:unnamed protein product [Ilex paraguariensis]|uniref:SEP domain-containing protein n=1 Tax=Ilex paraguariensis TaxID=185542 RepID=A0ABC8TCZ2_9AQUA
MTQYTEVGGSGWGLKGHEANGPLARPTTTLFCSLTISRKSATVEGPADHLRPSSSSRTFTGPARLFSGETVQSAPQRLEAVTHDIIFWSNGFTIDNGALRSLEDPENASFLEVGGLPFGKGISGFIRASPRDVV